MGLYQLNSIKGQGPKTFIESLEQIFLKPTGKLEKTDSAFVSADIEVLKAVKSANPNVALGEQCGEESKDGFSFPPGRNDFKTACGGTPAYGGGSCNTDPECFYTGYCFYEFYCYLGGCYGYCWVPSCYGKCGKDGYIWDSITGTCGCVKGESNEGVADIPDLPDPPGDALEPVGPPDEIALPIDPALAEDINTIDDFVGVVSEFFKVPDVSSSLPPKPPIFKSGGF